MTDVAYLSAAKASLDDIREWLNAPAAKNPWRDTVAVGPVLACLGTVVRHSPTPIEYPSHLKGMEPARLLRAIEVLFARYTAGQFEVTDEPLVIVSLLDTLKKSIKNKQ